MRVGQRKGFSSSTFFFFLSGRLSDEVNEVSSSLATGPSPPLLSFDHCKTALSVAWSKGRGDDKGNRARVRCCQETHTPIQLISSLNVKGCELQLTNFKKR